jgi:hypothetical protein
MRKDGIQTRKRKPKNPTPSSSLKKGDGKDQGMYICGSQKMNISKSVIKIEKKISRYIYVACRFF